MRNRIRDRQSSATKSSRRNVLVAGWIAGAGAIVIWFAALGVSGQIVPGPEAQPLLQQSDLDYQGSFRLPRSAGELSDFQYGGASMVFNPANGSLFIQARGGYFAEIAIPGNVSPNANYGELPIGTVVQPFALIDDQRLSYVNNPDDMSVRGLLIDRGQLIVSFASYYDANYGQTSSHLVRPMTLATTGGARGPYKVGTVQPGHVAGYMTSIPLDWQATFGGPALTGNFGLPIITRESRGPAAFVFNPALLGLVNPTPATPVLDYPDNDRGLAPWDGTSGVWNSDSTLSGMAFVAGTRSVLFFGTHGVGAFCYGEGGSVNTNSGTPWCYDPESGDHGTHTYPYTYRVWAYDANDLAAVKDGSKDPWEPRPYGVWNLALPMTASNHKMSAAYDPATQRIFVLQGFGPTDPAEGFPVVHVYKTGAKLKPAPPQSLSIMR